MLKSLRKKKLAKMIWTVLAIIIVPAFVFWGSSSIIRSKEEPKYAGKIFGRKITFLEFQDAVSAVKNQVLLEYGEEAQPHLEKINLEYEAWMRLLLLAEAKKRKIKVSDTEAAEGIKNFPIFQRRGRFDDRIYQQMLQYVFRTQARIFEEEIRQNLKILKLYREVTKNVTIGEDELKAEYRKLNEQISLYYLAGLSSDFQKDITAPTQELKDFFTNNPLQFKQPLSFNLEYMLLESNETDKKADEEKLKEIFNRLNKKEEFIKIAQDYNLKVKETGLFSQEDSIPGIGWSPQLLSLAAKQNEGDILPPLIIEKSYYIFRLKEKKEPYIPEFDSIQDKVKEAFIKDKSQKLAQAKVEECLKKINELYQVNPKAIDFEKLAKSYNLKASETDLFKYGSYIEGIGASDEFFLQAQKLKGDELSAIISAPSGYYIIKLKSKIEIDENKFNEERESFLEKLLAQKRSEFFSNFIEELKKASY